MPDGWGSPCRPRARDRQDRTVGEDVSHGSCDDRCRGSPLIRLANLSPLHLLCVFLPTYSHRLPTDRQARHGKRGQAALDRLSLGRCRHRQGTSGQEGRRGEEHESEGSGHQDQREAQCGESRIFVSPTDSSSCSFERFLSSSWS